MAHFVRPCDFLHFSINSLIYSYPDALFPPLSFKMLNVGLPGESIYML